MHRLTLADELAEIRAEIARLRLREAQVKDRLLHAPLSARTGRWHRVEVEEVTTRQFDATLLPAQVRDDPAYWRDRPHQAVRTLPLPPKSTPPRPGWPIRRTLPLLNPLH